MNRNRLQYSRLTEGQAINILNLAGIRVQPGEKTFDPAGDVPVTQKIEDAYRSLSRRGYKRVST
jgi:hypothetical protein